MSLSLDIIINKELQSLILGFGPDVEVKEPEHLRDEIRLLLESNLKNYE